MFNHIRKSTIALILILANLTSCKKDTPAEPEPCAENGLPCLTTEGTGLFACNVNGEPWIAGIKPFNPFGPAKLTAQYSPEEGWLHIDANRVNDDMGIFDEVIIMGTGIFGVKNDSIRSMNPNADGYSNYMSVDCNTYKHDTLQKGLLNIVKFDVVNNILSGTFSMKLFNSSCADSIMYISDGRFDIRISLQ